MARILRAAERRRIPWKNGGGEAEDVASEPAGASWDAMDWRVSRAWIVADGPFSRFPGIDRTFLVMEGDGVELSPAGEPSVRLAPSSAPYRFAGDVATACRLLQGPVTAFNVMTARGRWGHAIERRLWSGRAELTGAGALTLAVLLAGEARLGGPEGAPLGPADAVLLASGDRAAIAASEASFALVRLWPEGPNR